MGNHPKEFSKKVFLEISQNSQENTCARGFFLPESLWHRRFPVNFAKISKNTFVTENLRWLLLHAISVNTKNEEKKLGSTYQMCFLEWSWNFYLSGKF